MSDQKIKAGKWFDVGLVSAAFLSSDGTTSIPATSRLTETPSPADGEKVYRFNLDDFKFTMTWTIEKRGNIPIYLRNEDGTKTLTFVSERYLRWMLALGIWRVMW